MASYKWELVEDGYHRESRLVDGVTGRILGGVSGSNYDNRHEWDANIRDDDRPHIGSFVTEGQAKKAVEGAVARKTKRKKG